MTAESPLLALRARYIFPVAHGPIEHGVVTIRGERIESVGKQAAGTPPVDLGNVAILPGLVNAHTHLEFSDLAAPLGQPGEPLPTWIRRVVALRRTRAPQAADQAIVRGLHQSQQAGVTAIGEISTGGWPAAEEPKAEVTVFHEALGLALSAVDSHAAAAAAHVEDVRNRWQAANLSAGISPHAPYSVHTDLLDRLVQLAIDRQAPLAMHVAESREELELLATGRGAFRELLEEFGVWQDGLFGGRRPLEILHLLSRAPRSLVIHGNYLTDDEIEFIARHAGDMSVVYCPRTHAYFDHQPYPLAKMLAAGVQVALGTDSRASNPDLSLWREMQHVASHHAAISRQNVLELGTLAGARALGQATQFGTLEAGKLANLAIVPLADQADCDPHELLLSAAGPTQVFWRGRSA